MIEHLQGAVSLLTTWNAALTILICSLYGLFVGAVPGLTATMATALIVPFTFFMDPVPALVSIVSLSAMAIFAGDIPRPWSGSRARLPRQPTPKMPTS